MNFKRYLTLAIAATTLSYTTVANANQMYDMNNGCNPCYETNNCYGEFTAFGNFMYWQVVQEQMQYAGVLPGGLLPIINGIKGDGVQISETFEIVDPTFHYEPGFQIGFGYLSPNKDWDATLSWTRLHQKINSNVTDAGSGIIPLSEPVALLLDIVTNPDFDGLLSNAASSHWDFQFDTIDFQIGRDYCFSPCFSLHSYAGVKGALIRQSQFICYKGLTADESTLTANTKKKNNFYGVGPTFGVDSSWTFFQDWNLRAGVGGGLIYGQFCSSLTPVFKQTTNSVTVDAKTNKKNRIRPMVDAIISLDWTSCFWEDFNVDIGIGYEVEYWWNQWQVPGSLITAIATNGGAPQGDLMMQGLTVHFGFKF